MSTTSRKKFDLILRGGHVIDPATGRDDALDVGIRKGKIASVAKSLKGAKRVIDVSGSYVLPGMIDTHAHVYEHVLGPFGLKADWCGIRSGVTTVVDQGGPGAITINGFREFIVEPAESRVLCFISTYLVGGMDAHRYPALHGPDQIDVKATVKAALENRDIVKGIKGHAEIGGASRWGFEVIKLAKRISRESGLPLYVHLGQLWPTKDKRSMRPDGVVRAVAKLLEAGDVLAHPFTRHPGGFVSPRTGKVHSAILAALDRGVRVDVGHGSHFSFEIARLALEQGIVPFTLGADMHAYSIGASQSGKPGWANKLNSNLTPFSLCHAMTELLILGMPLVDVVKTVTSNAAIMLGLEDEIGTFKRGRQADVTVLDILPGRWELRDNAREVVIADRMIVPKFVLRRGERYDADSPLLPAPVKAAA